MNTYCPVRPAKRSMSARMWSGVNATQSTTASKSRSLIFSRTDRGSRISAWIFLTWGGRTRPVLVPRLSTNSSMPLSTASREQAELITPVPPMKRTLRSPIPPSCPTVLTSVKKVLVSQGMDTDAVEQVRVVECSPQQPDARRCLRAYCDEVARRFDDGFVPARSISADDEELTPPAGLFLIATLDGEPVGCGALKFHPGAPAEIKRMWVSQSARGLGLGRRLPAQLAD